MSVSKNTAYSPVASNLIPPLSVSASSSTVQANDESLEEQNLQDQLEVISDYFCDLPPALPKPSRVIRSGLFNAFKNNKLSPTTLMVFLCENLLLVGTVSMETSRQPKWIRYNCGFLLSEVGVKPKKTNHVIELTTGMIEVSLYCTDSILEEQWRKLLQKYCRYNQGK